MKVKILHLYYDLMNLYGEYGNVKVLERHLQDQGFAVKVDNKTLGDELNFSQYDFIYIGCGTEKNLEHVSKHLANYREDIKEYIEKNGLILCTGNSFEMFGKSIDDKEMLNIFEYTVKRLKDRKTSDIIYTSDILTNKIVGFVNKMGEIENNYHNLFKVEFGIGCNKDNKYEGVYYKNFFGTYVSGPILARNPELLKLFVIKLCEKENIKYKEIKYENEEKAYKLVLTELEKRK